MKTKKIDKDTLHDLIFNSDSVESWIDTEAFGTFFKSDNSTCTFVIRRDGNAFEVDVRNYRKRDWSLLFYDKSARVVLQDLYNFLYC